MKKSENYPQALEKQKGKKGKEGVHKSMMYPLLFFPAHGKILAWAGRKIYPGREGNLKENLGE